VTGATGFIGGHLVEALTGHGCRVRTLVRNFTHAPRIARFPVEMVAGDITDRAAVARAASGCDIVIHAAMGTAGESAARRAATVQGTEAVLEASRAARVDRVVHISTISVYGLTPDGDLTESTPRCVLPDDYSRDKAEAERLAMHFHRAHGLPVSVIQPTVVYGPFAQSWTVDPLTSLREERVVLPAEGRGLCNAVYVDDVTDAIVRAAWVPGAVGERFLVSASEPCTWGEFYGAYGRMLGEGAELLPLNEQEFRRLRRREKVQGVARDFARVLYHPGVNRRAQHSTLLRLPLGLARRVLPRSVRQPTPTAGVSHPRVMQVREVQKPLSITDIQRFRWMASRVRVRVDKARDVLGYNPRFDLHAGMGRTRLWAEWANLIN
jgi:nucleoside-diphosphate-sugar epimerase